MNSRKKIVVAMSGGVDSSVAAALLVEQGYDVIGITLHLTPRPVSADGEPCACACTSKTENTPDDSTCGGANAIDDAIRVCEQLGIPHYVLDRRDAFDICVIRAFAAEYARGRTPNPCIRCNQIIKFDTLRKKAREFGGHLVATGHYARIAKEGDIRHLLRATDPDKDQSYFLYALRQEQLADAVFPNGELTKQQVRTKAAALGLTVADKAESQDVCFASEGGYVQLLKERSPQSFVPGEIVHVDGAVLGAHDGICRYTVGQRRGLGVAWSEPLYVVAIDPKANRVIVGPDGALWRKEFLVMDTNFAPDVAQMVDLPATCRVRRNMDDVPARFIQLGDDTTRAWFDDPVRAITPGQAAVFYDGDRVLGGGTISEVME